MATERLAIAVNRVSIVSETFIAAHIRELAPDRTVVLARWSDGLDTISLPGHAIEPDLTPSSIAKRRLANLVTILRTGRILELDRRQRADVEAFFRAFNVRAVLAEYGPIGSRLATLCHAAGIPLFVHFHGFDVSKLAHRHAYRLDYRRLAKLADGFIAPSRFLAEELGKAGFPAERTHVVPYGVSVEEFPACARPLHPRRLLAVGRMVPKKAPHLTIAAFGRIAEAFPQVVLEMIGDGKLMGRCRRLVRQLGLDDRVVLHGSCPSTFVRERMAAASVFLQHSVTAASRDTEGLPVAILEAMMSGLPVVSTLHAGIPEAVTHGETGFLVEEGDVEGMAAALRTLLGDDDLTARLGAAGARRARERFSRTSSLAQLRAILGLDTADPVTEARGERERQGTDRALHLP